MTKVKVSITTEDGEVLEQVTVIAEYREPLMMAKALVDLIEHRFDTEEKS